MHFKLKKSQVAFLWSSIDESFLTGNRLGWNSYEICNALSVKHFGGVHITAWPSCVAFVHLLCSNVASVVMHTRFLTAENEMRYVMAIPLSCFRGKRESNGDVVSLGKRKFIASVARRQASVIAEVGGGPPYRYERPKASHLSMAWEIPHSLDAFADHGILAILCKLQ